MYVFGQRKEQTVGVVRSKYSFHQNSSHKKYQSSIINHHAQPSIIMHNHQSSCSSQINEDITTGCMWLVLHHHREGQQISLRMF